MKQFLSILFIISMVNGTLVSGETNAQQSSTVEFDIRQVLEERMHLFEEAIRHIRQNNSHKLRQMDVDVEETISFFHRWQQTRRSIARGIQSRTSPDEKINQLARKFLESVMDAEAARSQLSIGWPLFVEKQSKGEQFIEKIKEFTKTHRLLLNKAHAMYQRRSAVSLPAMAGLYGPPSQIKLTNTNRCGIQFIIENNGISRLNEIESRVETTAGKTVQNMWTEPDKFTSISPGKAVKIELCSNGDPIEEDLVRLVTESKEIKKVKTLRIKE